MRSKIVLCMALAALCSVYCSVVHAETIEKNKAFKDVFTGAIDTPIEDIQYGIVCFPDSSIRRAAELEPQDIERLKDAYSEAEGECVIAPEGSYFYDYASEEASGANHFYIGLSCELPAERWTWNNNTKMLTLYFGGEYGGAAIYGGYGIVKSSYGDEYDQYVTPANFVWYKPAGESADEINAIGNEIYNKYKDKAKPLGDYEGTGDDSYFSGFDGTYSTLSKLPDCFTAEGCSLWAYDILQSQASLCRIPYTTGDFGEPISRAGFCELLAYILNMTPYREYKDLFENPDGYTVLSEKAAAVSGTVSVSYNDLPQLPDSVKYLSALGIVEGVGNGCFDPDGLITREQICVIFSRMLDVYPEFKDAFKEPAQANAYDDDRLISDWARESVYSMTMYGMVNGVESNCFDPQGQCTAEQAIVMISRLPDVFGIK